MNRGRVATFLLTVGLVCLVATGLAVVPATANHGGYPSRVEPGTHTPGATEVTVESHSVSIAAHEGLVRNNIYFHDGLSPAECSSRNTRGFGIDWGNNDSGTTVDESLLPYVWNSTFTEDSILVAYNDESPAMHENDEVVSVQGSCYQTPSEPGWYQATAETWTEELSQETDTQRGYEASGDPFVIVTHYYPICDCANESEARDVLGPPPSQEPAQVVYDGTVTESRNAIVESVDLANGGYVAFYEEPPATREKVNGGQLGLPAPTDAFLGASAYLEPGTHENVTVSLPRSTSEGDTVYVVAHRETRIEGEFSYVELWEDDRGFHDLPYVDSNADTRFWESTVEVREAESPATPTPTLTPTPTRTPTATPSPTATASPTATPAATATATAGSGQHTTPTTGTGAGFGSVLALGVLLCVAFVVNRRTR